MNGYKSACNCHKYLVYLYNMLFSLKCSYDKLRFIKSVRKGFR